MTEFWTGVAMGGLLAAAFLWSLWRTVEQVGRHRNPGRWLLLTTLVRVSLAAAVFVAAAKMGLGELAGCAAGFTVIRWAAVARMRPGAGREGRHAD